MSDEEFSIESYVLNHFLAGDEVLRKRVSAFMEKSREAKLLDRLLNSGEKLPFTSDCRTKLGYQLDNDKMDIKLHLDRQMVYGAAFDWFDCFGPGKLDSLDTLEEIVAHLYIFMDRLFEKSKCEDITWGYDKANKKLVIFTCDQMGLSTESLLNRHYELASTEIVGNFISGHKELYGKVWNICYCYVSPAIY